MGKSSDNTPDDGNLNDKIIARMREPSGQELGFGWIDHRQAALDELEKHNFPEDLVSIARNLLYHAPVQWMRQDDSSVHPALQALGKLPTAKRPKHAHPAFGILHENLQAGRGDVAYKEQRRAPFSNAGEVLAYLLLWDLTTLEIAAHDKRVGKRSTSPVRNDGLLSKRTISGLAIDMLEQCQATNYPPGPHLLRLFRALLQTDRPKLDQTRLHEAKWVAAHLIARDGPLTTRQLAKEVRIEHGTISKWLNQPGFKKKIEEERELIRALRERGWPRPNVKDTGASED
jgi:hypothetical protein